MGQWDFVFITTAVLSLGMLLKKLYDDWQGSSRRVDWLGWAIPMLLSFVALYELSIQGDKIASHFVIQVLLIEFWFALAMSVLGAIGLIVYLMLENDVVLSYPWRYTQSLRRISVTLTVSGLVYVTLVSLMIWGFARMYVMMY